MNVAVSETDSSYRQHVVAISPSSGQTEEKSCRWNWAGIQHKSMGSSVTLGWEAACVQGIMQGNTLCGVQGAVEQGELGTGERHEGK